MVCVLAVVRSGFASDEQRGSFIYHGGLVFVEGRLNDKVVVLCLLDSGANVSAIDSRLGSELSLEKLRDSEVVGSTGTVSADMVRIDTLSIHGATVRDIEVTQRKIHHGATPGGRRLDLIVGYDFLKTFAVVIDFRGNEIAFASKTPKCEMVLDMHLGEGIPSIDTVLNHTHRTRLRIDTGASLFKTDVVYLNLTQKDERKLKQMGSGLTSKGAVSAVGVGGEIRMPVYELNELQIGSLTIPNPRAIIQAAQGYFSRPDAIGFVSNNLLEKYSAVVLDYRAGKLGLSCSAN